MQRTWIALEEKGVPYQYKEVNPYKKEKHFLGTRDSWAQLELIAKAKRVEINPKGLVPAIEYHGKALYESLILCEFLEDAYPNHQPQLLPADPYTRAYVRIWLDHISKNIVPAFFRLLQAQEAEKQQAALEEYTKALDTLAAKVKGPWFLGDEFSIVDVAIAPWIVRDYIVVEHRNFRREDVGHGWKNYAERVENRDSVLKTQSVRTHLVQNDKA